jgi:uncharacterized spore protein YtfJ
VGVNINIHKPPELLDARKFTDVTPVAFIVLSQDESTVLYLKQASKMMRYLVKLPFILSPKQKAVRYKSKKIEVNSRLSLSQAFSKHKL